MSHIRVDSCWRDIGVYVYVYFGDLFCDEEAHHVRRLHLSETDERGERERNRMGWDGRGVLAVRYWLRRI